jgi:UDP-N-acetyl-D-glucosamine dehydrogenase
VPANASEAELRRAIESGRAPCTVVGLGYVGTALAIELADAGFEVRAYDRSAEVASRFADEDGAEHPGLASVGTDEDLLAGAQLVHVAVGLRCVSGAGVDLEPLRAVAASLRRHAVPARLVVLHSTVPPGTTRWFAGECSPDTSKAVTFVAHCPERLQPGNPAWTVANTPHVVGGVDEASCRLAVQVLRHISAEVIPVSTPEVTELAKLMENAFIAVGVALVGEVASLAHALGVSGTEIAEAAGTKPFSYYPFLPGPGVGGHCIPNDLAMLGQLREELGVPAPLLDAADESVADLPRLTVGRLRSVMSAAGRELSGARVLLIGVGYKVNSSDLTNTPAREIVRLLRELGAKPAYLDDGVPSFEVDGTAVDRIDPERLSDMHFAAGLVLAGDPGLSGRSLARAADVVVDAGGGRVMDDGLAQAAERL